MDRGAWQATVHGVPRVKHDLVTKERDLLIKLLHYIGLPWWFSGKEPTCQCKKCGLDPWVEKTSSRRKWQLIPVFLLWKFHEEKTDGLQAIG